MLISYSIITSHLRTVLCTEPNEMTSVSGRLCWQLDRASAAAAVACVLLSRLLPANFDVESLLPPPLQAGLFSAIGWGLYTLSYETLGFEGMPFDPAIATWEAARLWLPAHILGIGLWLASRRTSSPALFPGFVVSVTIMCVRNEWQARLLCTRIVPRARSACMR